MKTVFLDIDTQLDFLYPAGALYVSGAERLTGFVGQLTQHAAAQNITVLSTTDAHAEDDPEFWVWPPHCIVGTTGQQKASMTLLPRRYVLTGEPHSLDRKAALSAQQLIVEKQDVDLFQNPNVQPLLDLLQAERYVVYGVVTEVCVAMVVRSLLGIGSKSLAGASHASGSLPARIEIVQDAVKAFCESKGEDALAGLVSAGAVLTSTRSVLERM